MEQDSFWDRASPEIVGFNLRRSHFITGFELRRKNLPTCAAMVRVFRAGRSFSERATNADAYRRKGIGPIQ
jgi:hypothetical protein